LNATRDVFLVDHQPCFDAATIGYGVATSRPIRPACAAKAGPESREPVANILTYLIFVGRKATTNSSPPIARGSRRKEVRRGGNVERLMRRLVQLMAAVCLLCSAATAYPECSWVVWASASVIGRGLMDKPTQTWPTKAFPTKTECDAGRNQAIARLLATDVSGVKAVRVGDMVSVLVGDPPDRTLTTYWFACLLNTIDPRREKGK